MGKLYVSLQLCCWAILWGYLWCHISYHGNAQGPRKRPLNFSFCKFSTDKHQYLLQSSCHPLHTKRAIPFSLALRLRRICSSDESFTLRANELIKYLNDRGYNLSFLKKEIQRVHAITRNETLKPSKTTTNQPSRVPLVITYNPSLRSISSIIRSISPWSV